MITIDHATSVKLPITATDFEPVIRDCLKKHQITDNVRVELNFVGRTKMKQLNRQYRQHNYPTDVLSFPIWNDYRAIIQAPGERLLGSIVICLPVAITEARRDRQLLTSKINHLIAHSLNHLVGIHHSGD